MKSRHCKICDMDIEGTDHYMAHFCKHSNLLENFPEWNKISQICSDFFLKDDGDGT